MPKNKRMCNPIRKRSYKNFSNDRFIKVIEAKGLHSIATISLRSLINLDSSSISEDLFLLFFLTLYVLNKSTASAWTLLFVISYQNQIDLLPFSLFKKIS
jgi:hypothetical protein